MDDRASGQQLNLHGFNWDDVHLHDHRPNTHHSGKCVALDEQLIYERERPWYFQFRQRRQRVDALPFTGKSPSRWKRPTTD
jgi:uncharacterized Fe-S cluster protein YjdI